MRRALPFLAALALAAVVVIGLTQAGGRNEPSSSSAGGRFDIAKARERLRGSPPPLAALHEQSNQLLGGGRPAFESRLRALRGHPVVINKWASWCGPCRAELPILQDVATERGRQVAFVGLDARDKRPAAAAFMRQYPVPYPSYVDPGEKIARSLKAPSNFPITLFVDRDGRTVFTHQGGYVSHDALVADIDAHLGA